MRNKEIIEKANEVLARTYSRLGVVLVEGRGALVKDIEGREYIDLVAGIAVLNVGHCHPRVVEAICEQARRLMHVSNLYYTIPQVELAELLTEISFADRVFFCNSGAEAIEACIKLVRRHTGRKKLIAAENSFHGRTMGALSLTGQRKYHRGFEPLLPGVVHVPFGDPDALRRAIDSDTAAVFLEPIQGEGGVIVPPEDYLREVREICDEKNVLLVLDEVQTGFGRTGAMFAYENFGIEPDVMAIAKALGGGFPIGAMLAREDVCTFQPGEHASTFGGNPLACAAAKAAIEVILEEKLHERARDLGERVMRELRRWMRDLECVEDVRGMGLMIGVELSFDARKLPEIMLEKGVLLNVTAERVIRLVPPLVIEDELMFDALSRLREVLECTGSRG